MYKSGSLEQLQTEVKLGSSPRLDEFHSSEWLRHYASGAPQFPQFLEEHAVSKASQCVSKNHNSANKVYFIEEVHLTYWGHLRGKMRPTPCS